MSQVIHVLVMSDILRTRHLSIYAKFNEKPFTKDIES